METVISFHSPTPHAEAVCFGRLLIEEIVVPLFASNQNTRPAPPFPMFCCVSEKILSPLSHAQQLAIILIEGVVAAWMISGFFRCVVFTLTRSISQVVFPQKSFFFFFSPYKCFFSVIGEFSALGRWNARLHNFLLESLSVQWYSDRESMAHHVKTRQLRYYTTCSATSKLCWVYLQRSEK